MDQLGLLGLLAGSTGRNSSGEEGNYMNGPYPFPPFKGLLYPSTSFILLIGGFGPACLRILNKLSKYLFTELP